MNVLHTLDSLNRGGAEVMELDVCRNARSAGVDLTFVATGGGDLEADFAESGSEFIRLQRKLPIDPFLIRELRKIIIARDIRVVHAHQAVEAIHLYYATRGTGVKCVMTLHGYITDKKNQLAAKFIIPRMDAVVAVSSSMLDWYRTGEGFTITDKFHVVLNPVDIERLVSTRKQGEMSLRDEFGMSNNAKLLGMIGNFYADARKDQWTVCRALPRVLKQLPDAHFVFVGSVLDGAEGYQRRCVDHIRENGLTDRVHFTGKRSDIPDTLRELDLFVFSSVQEGMPIAAIEALMLGVPMLVSNIPPLLEVIGEGTIDERCAEVFRTGDADDLAEKILSLFNNETRLIELSNKARKDTPSRFSIQTHLSRIGELYEQLTTDN